MERGASTEFSVSVHGMTSQRLQADLRAALDEDQDVGSAVVLEVRAAPHDTRSLDPTVLVAITSSVGTVIGAIVTGLVQLVGRKRGTIIVHTRHGERIEVPENVAPEQLELVVSKIQALDVAHIHMTGGR